MNRLFQRKKEPRRSSDDDYDKMQYWTPRGVLPTKTVNEQVQEVVKPDANSSKNMFPKQYRNREGNNGEEEKMNFQPYELRNQLTQRRLYEVPVNSRVDLSKKPVKVRKIVAPENVSPNDRGRFARTEQNDPGAFRGVVATNKDTHHNYGLVGLTYHPEGNVRALARAPVEPLDRDGRQYLRRFADDSADPHRVTTWPPRDEDAADLEKYEERYKKVRRPRPVQQPRNK
ncbi:hypothetical protein FGRMN_939 [Fusarium graminum]|nr:hypothetical protein FGRMN_939 [Fusarium graminum]